METRMRSPSLCKHHNDQVAARLIRRNVCVVCSTTYYEVDSSAVPALFTDTDAMMRRAWSVMTSFVNLNKGPPAELAGLEDMALFLALTWCESLPRLCM
jgi:hypothetical protein